MRDARRLPTRVRDAVMERDFGICRYCGRGATVVDHVVPVARGGTGELTNLVAACAVCNGAKSDMLPSEVPLFLYTPAQAWVLSMVRGQLIAETGLELFGPEAFASIAAARAAAAPVYEAAQRRVHRDLLRPDDLAMDLRVLPERVPVPA